MSFFSNLFGWLKGLFSQAAETMTGKMAESLAEIASAVVSELASGNLTSQQKRLAAYDRIWALAIAEGQEVTDAGINLAIELAVAVLKDRKA